MYKSIDKCTTESDQNDFIQLEYLNSLTPTGMPPFNLNLKIGAIVMLLKNMSIKSGLCNGTRMVIERCNDQSILASILYGKHKGKSFLIPRMYFTSDSTSNVQMERIQFPFRLAFAMTINKSQGQTFDFIGIYLREPVFGHGQLYVAFSRVRSFDSIKIQVEFIIFYIIHLSI